MDKKTIGAIAASAAASFIWAGPTYAGPKVVKGSFCQNNTCKGMSACGGHGNKNGCSGKNTCKGMGWLELTVEECAKDVKACKAACKGKGGKWAKKAKAKKKGIKKTTGKVPAKASGKAPVKAPKKAP